MLMANPLATERELARLGYYRLSGFWYPARMFAQDATGQKIPCPHTGKPLRLEQFQPGTTFEAAVELYRFDKALRLLMLDAIETIEVHLKTVVAHELGRNDQMAYTSTAFIEPKWLQVKPGFQNSKWVNWLSRQQNKLNDSDEDCIVAHRAKNQAMPIWVAVEAWDFGTLSIYYQMLRRKPQVWVAARLGLSDVRALISWLRELNTLRNRCAHHTRIWNQSSSNLIVLPNADPFFQSIALSDDARSRLYGLISVQWRLLQHIDPASNWIERIASLIDSKPRLPGCSFSAMGFPSEQGFPRLSFGI
ncbi:Abi family protein [Pseudomonas oryzihabitans]|nr:Abi family protein [Pseudomonas oryzihabitans]